MIPPAESGPDGKIPPAPGTNQIAGFVEFRPLTHREKNKQRLFTVVEVNIHHFPGDRSESIFRVSRAARYSEVNILV